MISVRAAIIAIAALLGLPAAVAAGEGPTVPVPFPVAPCSGDPSPAYAAPGDTPDIRIWRDGEIAGWQGSPCTGFSTFSSNTLMATAGRFRALDMETIAGRLAAISSLINVRYYAGDENWKNLYSEVYALRDTASAGSASDNRRTDFIQADIESGRMLRYWQDENSALEGIIYRLFVVERTPDKLVYTIVNETAAKALFLTASQPGEFRQYYAIEREQGDVWRYYSLVEAKVGAGPFSLSSRSFRSRATAYFRHLAGYPTQAPTADSLAAQR